MSHSAAPQDVPNNNGVIKRVSLPDYLRSNAIMSGFARVELSLSGRRFMVGRMPSATELEPANTRRSLSDLLDAYDNWTGTREHAGGGDFDGVDKVVALYRFAIANYDDPRIDLLLDAVAAVEKAGDTF